MIQKLSSIGGLNLRDGVKMILQRIMTNDVMALMNIKGKRGKIAFGTTAVFKAVIESAIQHFQTTERHTIEAVAQCLKYAPDRRGGGGRKKVFSFSITTLTKLNNLLLQNH
ncbi:uncharacterized protein LOC144627508 [Crassostrea virginica]